MPYEWDSFLIAADQWIINYSLPWVNLSIVKLFSIGHALELYLKAANTKIDGDIDKAIKFGHELEELWIDCKAKDPSFLPGYELRPSVLKRNLLQPASYSSLDKDDQLHFLKYQELYVVMNHLADLKYYGTPLKKVKGESSLSMISFNPLWAELFKELRAYLGHPQKGKLDMIQHHIEEGKLPSISVEFLRQIVNQ